MRAYGAQESFKRAAPTVAVRQPGRRRRESLRHRAGHPDAAAPRRRRPGAGRCRAREGAVRVDRLLPAARRPATRCWCRSRTSTTRRWRRLRAAPSTTPPKATPRRCGFSKSICGGRTCPSEIPAVLRAVKAMRLSRVEAGYFEDDVERDRGPRRPRPARLFDLRPRHRAEDERARRCRSKRRRAGRDVDARASASCWSAQLSAARCSDSVAEAPIAETFNTIVRRRDLPPDLVAPLTAADVWPAKVLGAAPAGTLLADRRCSTAAVRVAGAARFGRRAGVRSSSSAAPSGRRPRSNT